MASSFVFNCDFTLLKSHFTGLFTDDNLLYDYQQAVEKVIFFNSLLILKTVFGI